MNPIAQVDILAKVLDPQELLNKWDLEKRLGAVSFCTAFWCASSWHSHLIRSAIFGFFYQGTLKSLKNHKTHKIHAHNIQGVFFLRSPKRRRQLGHRHKGLGILKSMNIHANHLYWFNKWQFVVSTSMFLKSSNMHTNISHAWIFINVIFYESVCPWIFINVIFY